jgi:hypothetical protein
MKLFYQFECNKCWHFFQKMIFWKFVDIFKHFLALYDSQEMYGYFVFFWCAFKTAGFFFLNICFFNNFGNVLFICLKITNVSRSIQNICKLKLMYLSWIICFCCTPIANIPKQTVNYFWPFVSETCNHVLMTTLCL